MNELKTLNLTLSKKWFDMIASGEKLEEYREIKPYWESRLIDKEATFYLNEMIYNQFDIVSANNGYSKNCPNIKWKHGGVTIGTGKPEWGAEPNKLYFILKIGDLV